MNSDDDPEIRTSPCLMSCLQNFGNMIFPGDQDFDQVCNILSRHPTNTIFVSLYCCDLNCGAKFEDGLGHDSNVDQVINNCKRFGISNIIDPGPPSLSECSSISASGSGPSTIAPALATITSSQAGIATPKLVSPFLAPLVSTATSLQAMPIPSTLTISTLAPSTTSPSAMAMATQERPTQTFWQKLSPNAKIGCILGLTLLILLILFSILFFIRHKVRSRLLLSRSVSLSPELPMQAPPSPTPASSKISSLRRESMERAKARGGGGRVGCRTPHIVVLETEGKNSVDEEGNRWPDDVVLMGEAKEMREWSLGYGLDGKGKLHGREREKR